MTDPTPEMVARLMPLARRIYADYIRRSTPGATADDVPCFADSAHGIQIAIAAIIETSERAAKLNDEYEAFIRLGSVGDAATALRAYDHIKPENG